MLPLDDFLRTICHSNRGKTAPALSLIWGKKPRRFFFKLGNGSGKIIPKRGYTATFLRRDFLGVFLRLERPRPFCSPLAGWIFKGCSGLSWASFSCPLQSVNFFSDSTALVLKEIEDATARTRDRKYGGIRRCPSAIKNG